MIRRLSVLLVALLALGFAVAGCGEDEDESKNDDAKPAQRAPAETDGAEEPDTETESEESAGAGAPQSEEAIEQCKAQVDANPQLSDEAKSRIGEVCENTAENDPEAAAEATRETCRIVVEESTPEGPVREGALEACDQATPPAP